LNRFHQAKTQLHQRRSDLRNIATLPFRAPEYLVGGADMGLGTLFGAEGADIFVQNSIPIWMGRSWFQIAEDVFADFDPALDTAI
jgi:hypothetical protein